MKKSLPLRKRKVIITLEMNSSDKHTRVLAKRIYGDAWSLRQKYRISTLELQDIEGQFQRFVWERK